MHSWILFLCWLNFNMWMTSVGCICDSHFPLLGSDYSSYPWCHSPRGRGRDLLLSGAWVGKTPDIQGLWHYSAVDIDQNLHDPSDIHDIKIISKTIVYLNVWLFIWTSLGLGGCSGPDFLLGGNGMGRSDHHGQLQQIQQQLLPWCYDCPPD